MNARPQPARQRPSQGPVGFVLEVGLGLFGVILASWGLGVLIELVGIYALWPEKAEDHSRDMVVEDLGYIDAAPRSLLIPDTGGFARKIIYYVELPYRKLGVLTWYQRAQQPPANAGKGRGLAAATSELSAEVSRWVVISMYVAQDTLLRFAIAIFAFPAFALACLLGAVDGLMCRDLRRWGGGRESSFVYHRAKRLAFWSMTGGFAAYLSWPFGGFNPAYMVLIFTALVAASLSTTLATFKKYV